VPKVNTDYILSLIRRMNPIKGLRARTINMVVRGNIDSFVAWSDLTDAPEDLLAHVLSIHASCKTYMLEDDKKVEALYMANELALQEKYALADEVKSIARTDKLAGKSVVEINKVLTTRSKHLFEYLRYMTKVNISSAETLKEVKHRALKILVTMKYRIEAEAIAKEKDDIRIADHDINEL
jgi:hypothetical protein